MSRRFGLTSMVPPPRSRYSGSGLALSTNPCGGYDLLPKELELFEHRRQGQTGAVDEKELALVVTEALTEGQGAGR